MKSLVTIFIASILTLIVPSFSFGATVTSITQIQGLDFGIIDPNNNNTGAGGTVKSESCSTTGSVKLLTSCTTAQFLITGVNGSKGSKTNNVRVKILNPSAIITNGSSSMDITFSLNPNSKNEDYDQQFALSGNKNETGSVVVPIYSTITVNGPQESGTYNKSDTGNNNLFTVVACDDNNNCSS